MSKKLFIGGLAWATNDASLNEAFSQFGEVTEAKVILERDSNRSRGFGFVTFAEAAAADEAVANMDGKELDGRAIKVSEAQERPRNDRPRSGGFRR
jgi:RNA recognition motif-containing protein